MSSTDSSSLDLPKNIKAAKDGSSCAPWLVPLLTIVGLGLIFYLWYSWGENYNNNSNNNSNVDNGSRNGVLVISNMSNNDGKVVDLTGNQLKGAMNSDSPIVVALMANGCGHCTNLKPNYHKAAKMCKNPIFSMHAHTDGSMDLLKLFGIRGFPTILKIRKGQVVAQYEGDRSAEDIARWVNS
jgi:thiol-disulfide isomerase/thioredoxin